MISKRAALPFALVLSGASALVYELGWTRMLERVFGVSDLAIATVLAAYFLGLGLGGYAGGRLATRTRRPERLYAIIEIAVAIFAALSLVLVPFIDTVHAGLNNGLGFGPLSAIRFALALVVLLPPTILMGATLPILVSRFSDDEGWARRASVLYATNTVGATAGGALAGFWLLPAFGTRASVMIAAAGSMLAALVVTVAFAKAPPRAVGTDAIESNGTRSPPRAEVWALLAAGFGGAAALAGEVVWTRVLRIVVQGTTQAFTGMLVVYLAGIALGGAFGARLARDRDTSARRLGVAQLALAGLSAVSLLSANALPPLLSLVEGPGDLSIASTKSVVVLASVLLGPIAFVLGTTIPLAWGMVPASATGRVLAANTIGGLVGSLTTGFVLIPALGVSVTVRVLVAIHALVAAVALLAFARAPRARAFALAAPTALLVVVFVVRPTVSLAFLVQARNDAPRAVLENWRGTWIEQLAFLREGRNTTVSVVKDPSIMRLYNDGRPESGLSADEPGFGPELILLGALPSVYGTRHERAMAIGLGGGHTATGLLAGEFRRVDVVELEEAVVEAARLMHAAMHKPFPLDDPRAHLIVDDARAQIARAAPSTYDAIVSQPSHPWLAGSSALYTKEFFGEVERALAPDGTFVLWVNLFRNDVQHVRDVVATLLTVFPSVEGFAREGSNLIFVAKKTGSRPASARFEVIRQSALARSLEPSAMGTQAAFWSGLEMTAGEARRFARGGVVLTDDVPRLEFDLGRLSETSVVRMRDLDDAFGDSEWFTNYPVSGMSGDELVALFHARVEQVASRPRALSRVERTVRRVLPNSSCSARQMLDGDLAFARGELERGIALWRTSGRPDATVRAADWSERLAASSVTNWASVRDARALAVELTSRARENAGGGNDAAALEWATRSLATYPGQASAAVLAAEVLVRQGDRVRAQEVLDTAFREVRGLPDSSRLLTRAATKHGLRSDYSSPPSSSNSSSE
jgi:spermidine synthase